MEGAMDAANILKPALARGRIKLIGATTFEEFKRRLRKILINRRFQSVKVDEPSAKETVEILKGCAKVMKNIMELKSLMRFWVKLPI